MGMNLTKKTCVKYGQTDDVEKKFLPFDEVVALAQQVVKEPEHTGNYHDFVELCKLYDKNENGTMMLAELETFLTLMGKIFNNISGGPIIKDGSMSFTNSENPLPHIINFTDKLCKKNYRYH